MKPRYLIWVLLFVLIGWTPFSTSSKQPASAVYKSEVIISKAPEVMGFLDFFWAAGLIVFVVSVVRILIGILNRLRKNTPE